MANEKRPKWDTSATVEAAAEAYSLGEKYLSKEDGRLAADDLETVQAGGLELSLGISGQSQTLTHQKASTAGKEAEIDLLNSRVISLHNIVAGATTTTPALKKTFGVGSKMIKTADSVTAGANTFIEGYNANTAWCNSIGIVLADITELKTIIADLNKAKGTKNESVLARKLHTMDKVSLQILVEGIITKISTVGAHVYAISNPALAKLFANLIPGSSGGDTTPPKTDSTTNTKTA